MLITVFLRDFFSSLELTQLFETIFRKYIHVFAMQSVSFIRDLYSSIYAVIKRETCVSIRFTALDIEISTKFNYFK